MKRSFKKAAWRYTMDALVCIFGSVFYALGVILFLAPNAIAPGGLVGIATILNHEWSQINIGTVTLVMNVPLFLLAWWRIGREFALRTALVTVLSSVIMELLERGVLENIRFLAEDTGERILASIFGGLIMGFGIGLVFSRGATTGGSEVVARLIERRMPHVPIGRLLLGVDALIVVVSMVVFSEVQAGLCAVIAIYGSTRVIDMISYGGDSGRMLLITTQKEQEITDGILSVIGRGVTKLKASGGYTGEERNMLLCAVRPSEVYQLRRLVRSIDPKAFIIVVATEQTLGEGFIENE